MANNSMGRRGGKGEDVREHNDFIYIYFLSMYDSKFLLRSSKLLAETSFHNILLPVRLECVNTHVLISKHCRMSFLFSFLADFRVSDKSRNRRERESAHHTLRTFKTVCWVLGAC